MNHPEKAARRDVLGGAKFWRDGVKSRSRREGRNQQQDRAAAMPPPRRPLDPEGHYARLGVPPSADPESITAAYRREARLVHPDVPVTGNAAAFMALKQAYDVLIHAESRAVYDRSARPEALHDHGIPGRREPGEIDATPFPDIAAPRTRHPRLHDLPVAVWVGMAAILLVGTIEIGLHLAAAPNPPRRDAIPPTAREVPPLPANEPAPPAYGPAPAHLAGTPNFYIVPPHSPAMLWRADESRHALVPWRQLPPFSTVQGLRLLKSNGMVEVKVTDTANGFVEAGRLTPGDTAAAARAWCTYYAGPTPANGEMLTRNGHGRAMLAIDNRSGQPAAVKLRSSDGAVIASVFLAPGGQVAVEDLPEQAMRLDFATGEVWSRACHGFAVGMRALRLPDLVTIGAASQFAIPPGSGSAPFDLPDQAFQQE